MNMNKAPIFSDIPHPPGVIGIILLKNKTRVAKIIIKTFKS